MSDALELAKMILEPMRKLHEAIPPCKRCRCNWPKEKLNANGVCPNCMANEKASGE